MEPIEVGFQAYVADGGEECGAVRAVAPNEVAVWIENAGNVQGGDCAGAGGAGGSERSYATAPRRLHQGHVRLDGAADGERPPMGGEADRRRAGDAQDALREVDARPCA